MTKDYEQAIDRPWLQQQTIAWMESIIQPEWTIVETGMGGSTLFFAQRCARLYSYEHDRRWHERTVKVIDKHQPLKAVTSLILDANYPDDGLPSHFDIDLVLIDGRGRVRSVLDAMKFVTPGGWLVLDDSQRLHYERAILALEKEWREAEGKVWVSGSDETRAWRKPL